MVNTSKAFDGYYRNTEATKTKLVSDVLRKGDKYFRTGDLVKYKWDSLCKFIMFEDRIGDTFRWKGENVSTLVIIWVVNFADVTGSS